MNIPADLHYTKEHEWVRIEGDTATIGVTDFAQGELGDVVFVQLPNAGTMVTQGQSCGTIEAVKAVSDIYSPVSGEVKEVNSSLTDTPDAVNRDPYGAGWMIKIRTSNFASEKSNLLSASAYTELTSA